MGTIMGWHINLLAALTTAFCVFQPGSSGHPCTALRKLENGQTFFRYGGLFATFSCRHGYRLHGHRTNSCVSGRWTREPPVCVGSGCPLPAPVAHGSFSLNTDESWVEFSCDSGYKLLGASRLHCKGNEWSSSQPLCEEPDLTQPVTFRVTAQTPPESQTLKATADLENNIPSHDKTSRNVQDVAIHLNKSNSSTEIPEPDLQQQQPPISTASTSSEKHNVQNHSTKQTRLLQEPQTLFTPVTAPKKHIPTSAMTILTKTFASTSRNDLTNVSQAITLTLNKAKSQIAAPSGGENADETIQEDFHSQAQPFQQSPMSSHSTTTTQPYAKITRFQSTLGNTSSRQPITPSGFSLHSSNPTSELAHVPTVTTPDLIPSMTLRDQPASQNVESSNTKQEIDNDGTIKTSNHSCPSLPALEHGALYYINKETPGSTETVHSVQYVCDQGFTLAVGDAVRHCQEGATWSGTAPHCIDVDECALGQHHCEHICINTEGSFLCSCHVGYQPSPRGTSCTDVDECAFPAAVNGCLFGCVNTPGSFFCLCPPGFTLLSPGQGLCQDIDECADNGGLGPCSELCHNTPGSFHCSCSHGLTLAGDGLTCVPECPRGYRKLPLSAHNSTLPPAGRCVDVNECEDEELCEWKCINLPGTYRCVCPRGHALTGDGRCIDIDECMRNNGGCSHICINLKGTYKCSCPPSHHFAPFSWKNCVPRI